MGYRKSDFHKLSPSLTQQCVEERVISSKMPGKRPAASGYARIAQAEEEEEEAEEERAYSDNEDDPFSDSRRTLSSQYAPIQPGRRESMRQPYGESPSRPGQRKRTNSGVDIKAINARLERWADEIKDRFTRRRVKGKSSEQEHLEIHHSVFQAVEGYRPATKEVLESAQEDDGDRMSKLEFDDLVEAVRTAIELGIHPSLISQGSSGSYFAKTSSGKVVGVFKPKDEEPYASKNPKWTKWIHRNLFPFAFGRAMLIPNLSYVSEAAAYVLDCQLRTNLVPYTDVIGLSSKSFHYDWIDRRAFYRKKRPFPEKLGSFQVFLKGYKGATDFLREHPWPDHPSNFQDLPSQKRQKKRWDNSCRPGRTSAPPGTTGDYDSDDEEEGMSGGHNRAANEYWSPELQQSFREELEKLVILDYVMRNTDRGTDNWMIKIDKEKNRATIVKEGPARKNGDGDGYNRRTESMTPTPETNDGDVSIPKIGAIDNSLSWPWKHPDAWRSYPFGWLFLPVSLIGRPFSEKTKRHFLPLLTSKDWWSDTQVKLRACFEIDADFQEKMFARQMAVMKGQAFNVVEALRTSDHGPLELTRRNRVLVWDDLVDIPVAVPLPRASEEMRRRAAALNAADAARHAQGLTTSGRTLEEEEEMDISFAHPNASSASVPNGDLLAGIGRSSNNRFNHSRQNSAQDIHRAEVQEVLKENLSPGKEATVSPASLHSAIAGTRPGAYRSKTALNRMSHDMPRPMPWQNASSPVQSRSRRFSFNFSSRRASFGFDDDGDLGYAAAATQESSMRKVIVERLEVVKSKKPVFSWC